MIRFIARGAYFLLVSQERAIILDRALIRDRARLFHFRETNERSKQNSNTVFIKERGGRG